MKMKCMNFNPTRRQFLKSAAATGALFGLDDWDIVLALPPVSPSEGKLDPDRVRFSPEIEPLVRLIEDTPRGRLLEEVGFRIRRGLSYRDLLAALLLAGIRDIEPRPVGFKFHAVLVVNSAHLASLAAPDSERWLPIFWALDYFKSSQEQNEQNGDWHLRAPDDARVPSGAKARQAFVDAIDNWDEAAADRAVTALARSASAQEVFELFCRYGARDFRDIGHKAIYVANSWRALQCIGWHHSEHVLRSLAYALLDHTGSPNPAQGALEPDLPGRRNLQRLKEIRTDWLAGAADDQATFSLLDTLREGSAEDASGRVVELLNRGVAAQSIWDALFAGAGELLMRNPGIGTLHAVTSTNALHFAWQNTTNDETRRFLLLQNAAFLPLFRGGVQTGVRVDQFEPVPPKSAGSEALPEIFAMISHDRLAAARLALAWLKSNPAPHEFIGTARRLVFFKGNNPHDYKFSSAVLEDYQHLSPGWRERYLAASVFKLDGSGTADNDLVKRTRAALLG
jgi:hypothetical protein